jgi:hypothetical protein
MRCFNHPHQEAHGICKVCSRGVCADCSADLGHSLACKNSHEQLAEELHALVLRSVSVQKAAKRSVYIAPVFFAFMGIVFLVTGFQESSRNSSLPTFMGLGFLVFAAVVLVINRRAYGKSEKGAV